jgi:hypothetical protein
MDRRPPPAALFCGLLAGSDILLASTRATLERDWGPLALASTPVPWNETSYYEPEMGRSLLRQYLGFARPVSADRLAPLKLRAVELEHSLRPGAPVSRPVNIDPGLLDANLLALASTKRAGHRLWIGDGIWAEITLVYRTGAWQPLPWTYPDFRRPQTLEFLSAFRQLALPALRT